MTEETKVEAQELEGQTTDVEPSEELSATPAPKPFDFWDTETWGEKTPKEVIKEIRTQYDKKAEELSLTSREKKEYESRLTKVLEESKLVLSNEGLYKMLSTEFKKQNGIPMTEENQPTPPPKVEKPKLEITQNMTAGELVAAINKYGDQMDAYIETTVSKGTSQASQIAESKVHEERERTAVRTSIDNAFNELRETYGPSFAEVELSIRETMRSGMLDSLYKGKGTEKELVETAFKALHTEKYQEAVTNKAKPKDDPTTVTGNTRPTKKVPPKETGNATIDIVNKIRSKRPDLFE